MLDISRDIHSLTDFKKNTSEFINQMKQTGEPVILTIKGKAELVVHHYPGPGCRRPLRPACGPQGARAVTKSDSR
jgi:hypothetical protein